MNLRHVLIAAALTVAGSPLAPAHELWFLPDPKPSATQSRLYFGDSPAPGEAERVAEIAHARVWSDGKLVEVRRLVDGLEVPVSPGSARITSAYADRGVIDHEGQSFIITLAAYAMSQPVPVHPAPRLGLDEDQLRLLWFEKSDGSTILRATRLGKPAAGVPVKVFRGTSESTEVLTDANGEMAVPDRTRGGVSCLAVSDVATPGKRDGKAYSFIRYKATLTLYPVAR